MPSFGVAAHVNGVLCPDCKKWILLDIGRRADEDASYQQVRCAACGRRYGVQVDWVHRSIRALEIKTDG